MKEGFSLKRLLIVIFSDQMLIFFRNFIRPERKKNDHWITEDGMIQSIYQLDTTVQQNVSTEGV